MKEVKERTEISYEVLMTSQKITEIKMRCVNESNFILYKEIYEQLHQWVGSMADFSREVCNIYIRRAKEEIYNGTFRLKRHVDRKEEFEELQTVE